MSGLNHPSEINRDYIRLLQVMRRFVQEEFKVAIRMTQEDAVEQLLHYAGLSRNNVLQEMGNELREFTGGTIVTNSAEEAPADDDKHIRYYRGVALAVEESATSATEVSATAVEEEHALPPPEDSAPQPKKPTRIYRGRAVSV